MWQDIDTAPHDRIVWLKKADCSYRWCGRWVDFPMRDGTMRSGWWVYGLTDGWVEDEHQEKYTGWDEYLDIPYYKQSE